MQFMGQWAPENVAEDLSERRNDVNECGVMLRSGMVSKDPLKVVAVGPRATSSEVSRMRGAQAPHAYD